MNNEENKGTLSPITFKGKSNVGLLTTSRILKPVVPPTGRDGSQLSGEREAGYMSSGPQIFNSGYVSQGGQSDNESARLSNVNTFKYNGPSSATKNLAPIIKKVPAAGVGATMDYSSPAEQRI